MPTVTTSNLSKVVKVYYDRLFLEKLVPNLTFHQHGVKKPLPRHEGDTVYWHRWNLFTKGRLISESGAGTARGISASRISAQLLMIGDHAKITTYIDMVSISSVVQGAVELFADSSALTIDFALGRMLLWKKTSVSATLEVSSANAYLGAVNYLSAIGTLSAAQFQAPLWGIQWMTSRSHAASALDGGNSGTLFTPNIIRQAVLKLRVKNAIPFEDGYFHAIAHPDLINDLRGSSAFIDLNKYVDNMIFAQGKLPTGGVGERNLRGVMEGVKFYESTEAPYCTVTNGAAGASAHGNGRYYFTFLFGKNSYGVTDFDSMKGDGAQIIVKTPGPQDTSNPLNLYSTVGYRAIFTGKILNPSACMWLLSGKPLVTG